MEGDFKKAVEDIMSQIQCPKDFECVQSGFRNLCKARDVDLEEFLVCLEEHPKECTFSIQFGGAFFCQCPLRVYLAKNSEEIE